MAKLAKPSKTRRVISPGWWILYGLLCGVGVTGLLLFLVTPPRGRAVALQPAAESAQLSIIPVTSATRTPLPTDAPLRVNINNASVQELELLPSIGPSTAQAIIAYRERHGVFTALDELLNVPGIGPKTFEGLQGFITLEDE